MLRSAQPSQFSTYPSQYIDTPVLAVLYKSCETIELTTIREIGGVRQAFKNLCIIIYLPPMTERCTIWTCRCTLPAPLLLFWDLSGPCWGHLEAASVSCVGILTFWRRDSSPARTRWQQLTRRNRSINGVELSLVPRVSPLHNCCLRSCEGPKRTVGVDVAVSCLIGNVQFNLHIHLRSSSKSYSKDYTQ